MQVFFANLCSNATLSLRLQLFFLCFEQLLFYRLLVSSDLSRVTRFSPIGRLFSLGSLKKCKISPHFGQLFSSGKCDLLMDLTKNLLGSILGKIFTNSSGHPGPEIGRHHPEATAINPRTRFCVGTPAWSTCRLVYSTNGVVGSLAIPT
jgi:hypothetical protein